LTSGQHDAHFQTGWMPTPLIFSYKTIHQTQKAKIKIFKNETNQGS